MTVLRFAAGVELDADLAGGWTYGVLAKKGAGKTYGGRVMAEEMLAADIPIVALDPTGAWWGLRAGAAGTKQGGLQVVIFGGEHGDVPLEPTAGKMMADLVADEHVPMVLDMSAFGTRAAERKFAKEFLERLYRRNKTLMHLFVDEADLFAPQKPQPGDLPLLGVMENLVRRGRIKGIGCTLITQRPAVLNKDVLTQVDVLVLLRTTGPQDRDAVKKWVDGHGDPERAKDVFDTLAGLQNGESWWWAPEIGLFTRTQIRKSRTFDSSPTPMRGGEAAQPKLLADVDLAAVRDAMAETIQRAEEEDPARLRERIAELEARLAEKPAPPEPEVVTVPMIPEEMAEALVSSLRSVAETIESQTGKQTGNGYTRIDIPAGDWRPEVVDPASPARGRVAIEMGLAGGRARAAGPMRTGAVTFPTVQVPVLRAGARRMLRAVADMDPVPQTRSQVAMGSKLGKTGGTFSTYLGELKRGGFLVEDAERRLTVGDAGWEALGGRPSEPTSALQVRELWLSRLTGGAKVMLIRLIEQRAQERNRGWMSRAELAQDVALALSGGTFSTYLGRLRTAGLIDEVQGGEQPLVRANEILFTGPRGVTHG